MKIVVHWALCAANGVCVRAAPESFHLDDKDRLEVHTKHVPLELRAKVQKAVRGCPKQALSLHED